MVSKIYFFIAFLFLSFNAFGVARWVNNQGATRPATVMLGCTSYATATTTYTDIQSAINAAVSGDIVYITDGIYNNPFEYSSTNCAYAGTAQDPNLLFDLNSKFNIIITSSTGHYCNSNAVIRGKGFNFRSCSNVTVQGLHLDSIRVNAFYNSNCCGWGPSSNMTIQNNSITNVRGHGIKTDDGGPTGVSINRGTWNINGNLFQNIGFYTANGLCSPASTSAIWLAEAGANFNINNNTIINTNWAGILCMGWGGDNGSYTGMLTCSGNRIDSTLDAGIQLGFPLGVFYYPNGANINNNKITNANYSNKVGIGALTLLANNMYNISMTNNDISQSFNGLAINMAGWQNSFDTKTITGNNFYNLSAGSFGVTHIAGIAPNGLFGTGDSLTKYNLTNNYWGNATGPTYALNPGGTGEGLRKDTNPLGGGTYSLGEYVFMPFSTTPNVVNYTTNMCGNLPMPTNDTGANLIMNGANGIIANILANDTDPNGNPSLPVNGVGQFTLDLDINTIGQQTTFTNAQGIWTLNTTTGEVNFDPALNYNGLAVLPYTLCDPSPTCNCVNANIQFFVNPCLTTSSNYDSSVCINEMPITWNGITLNVAGIDTAILVNAGGCDSLAIIDLTVNPLPLIDSVTSTLLCEGGTATITAYSSGVTYEWLGQTTDTLYFNPIQDNTLYSENNNSNGSGTFMFAGKTILGNYRRATLLFDLSTIPAGTNIVNAKLDLTMNQTISGPSNQSLHKVLESWGEGTSIAFGNQGGGATPTTTSSTWNYSFYTSTLWTTVGGEFLAAPSATTSVGSIGSYSWNSTNLNSDIQNWVNSPSTNYGWILIGDELAIGSSAKRYTTRESSTPPSLMVVYQSQSIISTDSALIINTPGVYTVVATNANGCSTTTSITISAQPKPVVTASANMPLYTSDTLILTGNTITGATYSWAGPLAFSSTNAVETINNVTSLNSGNYTYTLTDSNLCANDTTITVTVTPSVLLTAKAFLSGPFNGTNRMHDSLRRKNLIPTTEPYSNAPYNLAFTHSGGGGFETLDTAVFVTSNQDAIVDWIFLELRDAANFNTVVATKSALIQRDGDIVSPKDGVSPVIFRTVLPNNYYVSVKHRNHLGIATRNTFSLSETPNLVDFTTTALPLHRNIVNNNSFPYTTTQDSCSRVFGTVRALYGGNCNLNLSGSAHKSVKYNGINNERITVLTLTGFSSVITGYLKEDMNMNGEAKYNGIGNDRLIILQNVGSNVNTTVVEQTQ